MIRQKKHLEWVAALFFIILIAVVFQQINTDMTEQGIASGGPYDNAAAYPMGLAIFMAVLVLLLVGMSLTRFADRGDEPVRFEGIHRPILMLMVFGAYLGVLNWLGYHLTTTPMIVAVMMIAGMRRIWVMLLTALVISFSLAFLFEFFLKIVLPGGIFRLNIAW